MRRWGSHFRDEIAFIDPAKIPASIAFHRSHRNSKTNCCAEIPITEFTRRFSLALACALMREVCAVGIFNSWRKRWRANYSRRGPR